jgi:hypothetical protein
MSKQTGNTIIEYLFIAVLMLGTFSVAFNMFGNGMNKVGKNLKAEFKARAENASIQREVNIQQSQLSINNPTPKPFQAITVDLDGRIMLIPTQSFTAGANGTQMSPGIFYQPILDNIAIATVKEEEEDNLLQNLANASHKAAELQEHLALLSRVSNGDTDRLQRTRIMIEGQPVDAHELANRLMETADIVSQQTEQVQKTVTDKETIDEVVERANQVIDRATGVSEATRDVLNRRGSPVDLSSTIAAEDTHKDAGVICRRGRRTDNGRRCFEDDRTDLTSENNRSADH